MDKMVRLNPESHRQLKEMAAHSGLAMHEYLAKIIDDEYDVFQIRDKNFDVVQKRKPLDEQREGQ